MADGRVSTPNLPSTGMLTHLMGNDGSGTKQMPIGNLKGLVAAVTVGPTVGPRADLDALLNYPADTGALVVDDPDWTMNGTWKKVGAPGTGTWIQINNAATSAGALVLPSTLTVAVSGNVVDFNPAGLPAAYEIVLTAASPATVHSMSPAMGGGDEKRIVNAGPAPVTIRVGSTSGTAAWRFIGPATIVLAAGDSVRVARNAAASRWRLVGAAVDVTEGGEPDNDDAYYMGDYVKGIQTDAKGGLVAGIRSNGSHYVPFDKATLAALKDWFHPPASTVHGVDEPLFVRRRNDTSVEFLARLEPDGVLRPYIQRTDIVSNTAMLMSTTGVRLFLVDGQSLGEGVDTTPGGPILVNASPPRPHDALMLASGARGTGAFFLDDGSTVTPDIVPSHEQTGTLLGQSYGETMVTAGLRWIAAHRERHGRPFRAHIGRTVGAGSRSLAQLSPGGSDLMFPNGVKTVRRINKLLGLYGEHIDRIDVAFHHGPNDRSPVLTPRATYKAGLVSLRNAMDAQWRPAGMADPVRMWLVQLTAPSVNSATTASEIALAQMDAAREDENIRLAVAPYWLQFCDALHQPGPSYARTAERILRAVEMEDVTGRPWQNLGVWIDKVFAGNTLTLRFFRDQAKTIPWSGLTIDTDTVPLAPGWGFKIGDGGGDRTITGCVPVTTDLEHDTLALTFSGAAVEGGAYASYAYDGPGAAGLARSGAWGNIRDTDDTPSESFPDEDLVNWLSILNEVFV